MADTLFITGELRASKLAAGSVLISQARVKTSFLKAEQAVITKSIIKINTLEADKLVLLVDRGVSRIGFLKSRTVVLAGSRQGRIIIDKMMVGTALLYNVFAPIALATSDVLIAGSSKIELLVASRDSRVIAVTPASIHSFSRL